MLAYFLTSNDLRMYLLATWYAGIISIPQLSSRNCLHCVVMKSPANGDFTIA